mmetsp:Transcript_16802/g.36656  ORF Transcript_16802/g.36656 Transcript_16802/m.36656 type:complete len:280 (-) Transcript_16802:290-1129(-)
MLFASSPLSSLSSYWSEALAVPPSSTRDENDSISSTFTALTEDLLKKEPEEGQEEEHEDNNHTQDEVETTTTAVAPLQQPHQLPASPVIKKHVTFHEIATEYDDPRGPMTDDDLEQFWLTADDYHWLKQQYRHSVQHLAMRDNLLMVEPEIYERHQAYSLALLSVYDSCCQEVLPSSSHYNDYHSKQQVKSLAHQLKTHLPHILHGLERASSRVLVDDKAFRRSEVLETVLTLQEEFSQPDDMFVTEMIRCAAENVTQPARLFAQRLAAAHAQAVLEQH